MKKLIWILIGCFAYGTNNAQNQFSIHDLEYFDSPANRVLVFNDEYSEGHQGGIQIIMHGNRVAANGDLRLEPTPGQWQPFSQLNSRRVMADDQVISVSLSFPNEKAAERGFNRISYPDLDLDYQVKAKAEGESVRISVDLEKPLPKEWVGLVGFNLELFPGDLFSKKYYMDGKPGIFPTQLNGPFELNEKSGHFGVAPMAEGTLLVVAPEEPHQCLTIRSEKTSLMLLDGRAQHNNGWFIVRSLVPKGAKEAAVEWLITPVADEAWRYGPVIHINQAGYLPKQSKHALIECDPRTPEELIVKLWKLSETGTKKLVLEQPADLWGPYQRYLYYHFDFTPIEEPGIYLLETNGSLSETFPIAYTIYERGVWQPTLEYFLPIQMCHMRINDRYRVWHGLCHMDDARMAPTGHVHFDGYYQDSSTLCRFNPGDHVPNLNIGGWHDAGDYDLRVESQGRTVHTLSLIWEAFRPDYDITTINQEEHLVEMHIPDGKPDILQQIEHGTLAIVHGYNELGRLYRGIICNDLRQYVLLGDGAVMTDKLVGNSPSDASEVYDDRWVFTEINPQRELQVCAYLAAASRALKGYNDSLSDRSLKIAEELWEKNRYSDHKEDRVIALTELILTTNRSEYLEQLSDMYAYATRHIRETGWASARVLHLIDDPKFTRGYLLEVPAYFRKLKTEIGENPFGVPYHPGIWGSAWGVERFGLEQYYYYTYLEYKEAGIHLLNALDYLLGIHPGENTASFVSGVGTRSPDVAYGVNRADWSCIPGGVISGTATVKPDFPELKEWPFLWQQTEYMIGGAASAFMFLVLAASEIAE